MAAPASSLKTVLAALSGNTLVTEASASSSATLSAAGIFFVGCGVTVYHGIQGLLHPHTPELGTLTFVVWRASPGSTPSR